jgi:anti-sigma factor RsiW
MSSNSNHTNQTIHAGNYEEFFILYMDNELSPEQVEMVEQFVKANPDLGAELEMLMSTKLPSESYILTDKESLLSDKMKLGSAEEELLLYIDGELKPQQAVAFEAAMAGNKDLGALHQLLLKTKLDAAEVIQHPNKASLYRRTERRIFPFQPWMRIAAAVVVIAALGIVYRMQDSTAPVGPAVAVIENKGGSNSKVQQPAGNPSQTGFPSVVNKEATIQNDIPENNDAQLAANTPGNKSLHKKSAVVKTLQVVNQPKDPSEQIAFTDPSNESPVQRGNTIALDASNIGMASAPKEIINNSLVTSSIAQRNTIVNATPKISPDPEPADEVAKKGSIKGFLRKATRLVERTTGITATNEDGELLIGAVAVKLN